MALCRYVSRPDRVQWGWIQEDRITPLHGGRIAWRIAGRDASGLNELASIVADEDEVALSAVQLRAPILDAHEIWAAGVTYESSKLARMAESPQGGDFYAKVYSADRPELFFKATPNRVVGPNESVRIRADSAWNVPEPELAALITSDGRILGYTIGNDMSSRDIEGANPLYLPQAKVYRGCCALGPWIVPAESLDPRNLGISMTITRGGVTAFAGETNTSRMRRKVEELVHWLFRENDFPQGVFLLTGTGIIPPDDFTLQHGDDIAIEIDGIGTLRNGVME